MKRSPNGPRFQPADLRDPNAAHDALLHWDMQDEQILRLLAEHPEHRGRLETLQRAEGWLRRNAARSIAQRTQSGGEGPGPDLLMCPPADELYDYASGPGAASLPTERREAIDRHLATCLDCERFAATLAVPPPPPLLAGEDEEAVEWALPETAQHEPVARAPIHRLRRRRTAAVLAVAAGLVALLGLWRGFGPPARATWPEAPLLRGESGQALLFPRDAALERGAELAAASSAFAGPIEFELGVAEHAHGRIVLEQHDGGAFADPKSVATWAFEGASSAAPAALAAGHYTWAAWSEENGLEKELGRRDFRVVADPGLARELAAILSDGGEEAGVRAVRLLHERGYVGDARALARTLPASPERDAYLGWKPGR